MELQHGLVFRTRQDLRLLSLELKQRLYVFDGTANKLIQIRLNGSGVPYVEITLFEGAPSGSTISASVGIADPEYYSA